MILIQMDDSSLLITEPLERQDDPVKIKLGMTAIVRRWGTTKGRGELALDGPTVNTIVDPEPDGGEVNWIHVRRVIPVTDKARMKWVKLLSGKK